MGKMLKWLLAGGVGVIGLITSFFISPTVFECKLFTACHEINLGYALMSFFSSETQKTISNEQLALQIAHSLSLTLIAALLGLLVGVAMELQARSMGIAVPAIPAGVSDDATKFGGNAPVMSPDPVHRLEMSGLDGFGEHYLQIDASELARMPGGMPIGRDPNSSGLVIDHETVSRRHAKLTSNNNAFMLEDLGSTNGTKLNGRSLLSNEPTRLRSGDRVSIGSVNFRIAVD